MDTPLPIAWVSKALRTLGKSAAAEKMIEYLPKLLRPFHIKGADLVEYVKQDVANITLCRSAVLLTSSPDGCRKHLRGRVARPLRYELVDDVWKLELMSPDDLTSFLLTPGYRKETEGSDGLAHVPGSEPYWLNLEILRDVLGTPIVLDP